MQYLRKLTHKSVFVILGFRNGYAIMCFRIVRVESLSGGTVSVFKHNSLIYFSLSGECLNDVLGGNLLALRGVALVHT